MLFAQRTAFAADVKRCKNTKLVISFTFESKGLIRQIKTPELCQGEYIRLPFLWRLEVFKLLLTDMTNRIHLARFTEESDGSFCIRGTPKDITDDALTVVFQWLVQQIENDKDCSIRYADFPYILEIY